MSHSMRLFHFYFEEVHNALGASPSDILLIMDNCERHAWTEKDAAELEFLWDIVCEFYGITRLGWEEFR